MSRSKSQTPPNQDLPHYGLPQYWIRVNDRPWKRIVRNAGAVYQHIVEEMADKKYSEFDLNNAIENLIK